jgi:hypothetical protein
MLIMVDAACLKGTLSVQKQITLHKQTHPRGTRKCKYIAALNIHRLFDFLCYSTILSFLLFRSISEYKILMDDSTHSPWKTE